MPLISIKNKDKFIGGIIGVIILACFLFVKGCFEKSKKENPSTNLSYNSKGAAKQNNSTSTQNNSGNSSVNNESFGGDKIVNNNNSKIGITKIERGKGDKKKGNFSYNNNGTLNQTYNENHYTKPLQRHVDKNQLNDLIQMLDTSKTLYIASLQSDKECQTLGFELDKILTDFGYKVKSFAYFDNPNEKFDTIRQFSVLPSQIPNIDYEIRINPQY